MRGFLQELAVDAAEAGKRAALDPSTIGTLKEELNRLVSVTAIAIERTEPQWANYIAPDRLADAIKVIDYSHNWTPDGKSVLVPYDRAGFCQAVKSLILIARVALGELDEHVHDAMWNPIDTAPMYVRVLVASKCGSTVIAARTDLGWVVERAIPLDTYGPFKITHWMPIPEPVDVTE